MEGREHVSMLATLCFGLGVSVNPGVTGPKEISACTAIAKTGSCVLSKNLYGEGDCLVVVADFVTVDLNGFTIAGKGVGSGVRAGSESIKGPTIRNGTIRHF